MSRVRLAVLPAAFLLSLALVLPTATPAQSVYDYSTAGGLPSFATTDPFPSGVVNIANGNFRIEIPFANFSQRGNFSVRQALTCDSKKWTIVFNSSLNKNEWLPGNTCTIRSAPNSSGWSTFPIYNQPCVFGPVVAGFPDGVARVFPISNCPGQNASSYSAYALDGSGYRVYISGCPDSYIGHCTSFAAFQPDGTMLPNYGGSSTVNVEDSNGNEISLLGYSGTPVDSLNRYLPEGGY